MGIELVAVDVDGTLVDSGKQIRPDVKKTIKEAADRGVKFAICTGRSPREIRGIAEALPEAEYGVTANGAYVVDLRKKETVFADTMSGREIRSIYRTLSEFDMMFEIFLDHEVIADRRCLQDPDRYGVGDLKALVVSTRTGIGDMKEYLENPDLRAGKVNIFFRDPGQRDEAAAKADGLPFYITQQEATNLEFTKQSVNKGEGLRKLAESLGIKRENTMAIGDNNNDIPMLEYAGVSVAMGNGLRAVKERADFVTATNEEDGVARALEKFVLGRGAAKEV